jgi:endoglucanase
VLILEPDALSQLYNASCLTTAEQTERLGLLNFAVTTLHQTAPNTAVYMDAGDGGANAIAASDMANRLTQAGVANAAGFSLNVSNYISTAENTTYGNQISALINNKHFVIDTSRNGLGSDGDANWCNPPGRGLGAPSQGFNTGILDGYLWVQNPGTSDGTCNGGPAAGDWWLQDGCTLANNAIF